MLRAVESADAARLGQLMNASHVSLRDDFEVSTPELDLLVALALEAGAQGPVIIKDFEGLLASLKARNIYTIARIVTFKDNVRRCSKRNS